MQESDPRHGGRGSMKAGTPQHRDLFCRSFIETHVAFEPEKLPWPELDALHLERLRQFPLWSYARAIEQRAGRMVNAFARTIDDPVIREAVALQGYEEARHGRLMVHVCERYGIDAPELAVPDPPARREDFLTFGFGECSDSFVGFGAFAFVRRKQLFPESLMAIFDNVLWEEARHIVFFTNWWRYEEALAGRDGWLQRTSFSLTNHLRAFTGLTKGGPGVPQLPQLDAAQIKTLLDGVTPAMIIETALSENRRHMARFDRRLIKPTLMPRVATAVLLALRMLPPRREAAAVPAAAAQDVAAIRPRNAA